MGKKTGKGTSRVVWPGFNYKPAPKRILKVGRNDPCPCGSGKKYKDCHEPAGEAWLEKMWLQQEKERLKAEGKLPWWRRIFG